MSEEFTPSLDAVARSKICARNYLDKEVPNDVIEHLLKVATGGPYKQGRRWLDVYAITDQEMISKLYLETARPDEENALAAMPKVNKNTGEPMTFIGNAQVLAPVLFALVRPNAPTPEYPDEDFWDPTDEEKREEEGMNVLFAVGSTMGLLVYEANRLGLHAGNCVCFDQGNVSNIIKQVAKTDDFDTVELMIGVGYPQLEWSSQAAEQMREHPIAEGHNYQPPHHTERDNPKYFIIN